MPKLYSSKEIIAVLKSKGFVFKSKKGSHAKYIKNKLTVIVPHPMKEIPYGTFVSILKQSGLSKTDFEKE